MTSVANVTNWSSINSVIYFRLNKGDGVNSATNIGYAQDFMKNNRGLQSIYLSRGYYYSGYRDATFKLTRLKTDWNTYFTDLRTIEINDGYWNREDLSALGHLNFFQIWADTQNHLDDVNSPLVPIPQSVVDNIISQIAAGAGKNVSYGSIYILTGDSMSSTNSTSAVQTLKAKGWTIAINSTFL
jgi:hypothetical protein